MRVLGISGSPKKRGFTDLLLDESLAGARTAGAKTDKIILNELSFKPCQECSGCDETGVCVIDDEMKFVYEKLGLAEAFIVASPIFFGSITAQLKAMIDRCQSVWVKKYVLKKSEPRLGKRKGVFICVGGKDTLEYFENARDIAKIFFRTLDIEYCADLFIGGLNEEPANSPKMGKALIKSFELGLSLVKSK